jgi:transcription initiation factor TFIID TATA-box-binding protein
VTLRRRKMMNEADISLSSTVAPDAVRGEGRATKMDIKIQNVVATASLGQKIDLLAIMNVFRNVEYRPKRFPGLVFRLKKPKTATLIFTTGKMVCTGAKTEKEAFSALNKVVGELVKKGLMTPGDPEIFIQNMVASANLHAKVDIEAVAEVLDGTMYEPEQFPGLIYRLVDPRVVFLIFVTGKIVIVGAKREEEIHEAVDKLYETLEKRGLFYEADVDNASLPQVPD